MSVVKRAQCGGAVISCFDKHEEFLLAPFFDFLTASNNEETVGKSPVSVVPMHQEVRRRPLQRQLSLREAQSDIFQDQGNSLWRTHLGLHRNSCTVDGAGSGSYHDQDPSAIQSTLFRDSSSESTESSEKLTCDPEEPEGSVRLGSSTSGQEEGDGKFSRKFSAPSVLSRQLSLVRHLPSPAHSTTRHYPFPQVKCPRKSEAARRLGMYSSF